MEIRKSVPRKFRSFPIIFLLSSSVFLLLFATLPMVHASSGIVQQNDGGCASTGCSPSAISFPSSVTSGDVIAVAIASYGGTVNSVTDTLGSSFTQATSVANSPMTTYIYYATLSSSGSDSITVSLSFTNIQAGVYIYEVSGVIVPGVTETGSGNCTSSPCSVSTASSATFQSGAFLLGFVGTPSFVSTTPGSGFTLSSATGGGDFGGYSEYSTSGLSSPTNFPFSLATSSMAWAEAAIALSPTQTSTATSSTSSSTTSTSITTSSSSTTTASFTNDQAASLVIGQPNFGSSTCSYAPPTATGMCSPYGIAFDSSHNLWVADEGNSRVLEYSASSLVANGPSAALVLGATSLTGGRCSTYMTSSSSGNCVGDIREIAVNSAGDLFVADHSSEGIDMFTPPFSTGMTGSLALGGQGCTSTASSICQPDGMVFDSSGNLWVADGSLNRVLEFSPPFSPGESAFVVIGQADFISRVSTGACAPSATSLSTLCEPKGVAFDSSGDLWVSDYGGDRVLEFKAPFTDGMSASLVIGTGSCTSPTSSSFCAPRGIAFDSSGNLWVADTYYNRVLEFAPPFTGAATLVLGQSDFTSESSSATSQMSLSHPEDLAFDSSGNLWVSDNGGNRVLEFLNSHSSTTTSTTLTSTSSTTRTSVSTSASSSTTFTTITTTTSTYTPPPMSHVSITLNPDITSNTIGGNNYFLVNYNDGAQEFLPQQGGLSQFEAAIGSQVIIAAASSSSNSKEEWCLQGSYTGSCNPIAFTVSASGDSFTYTYFDLLAQSVSYAIHGGGNPVAPSLTFITLPSTANPNDDYGLATITLSTTPQTVWALRTFSTAQPVQLSNFGIINTSPPTANEQWSAGFGMCCAITGPNTIPDPIIFYNQYSQQVSYSVTGRSGYSAPILSYQVGGKSQQFTLETTPFSFYIDSGSSWSATNPLLGSTSTYSWKAATASGTISGPGVIGPAYSGSFILQLTESNGISDFTRLLPEIHYKLSLVETSGISDIVSTVHSFQRNLALSESIALSDIVNTIHGIQYKLSLVESTLISDIYHPLLPVLIQLTESAGAQDTQNNNLISATPFVGKIFFIVHSPVNVLVTDSLGKQAGFNTTGSVVNTIPGAQVIPKNGTQLETIIVPDPITGNYVVQIFPVGGGGAYTLESQVTNANGTVVTDTQQTGTVTSGTQYLGVTLSPNGHVSESAPSTTPPFQKSGFPTLLEWVAIAVVVAAAVGGGLFVLRKRMKR